MKHLAIWRKMELLQEDIDEALKPYNLSDTAKMCTFILERSIIPVSPQ